MKIIQLFSLFILLNGCQTSKLNLGVAKDFLSNNKHLQEGIVNKYYLHHKKHDSPDIDTHIVYDSYQIKNDNLLHHKYCLANYTSSVVIYLPQMISKVRSKLKQIKYCGSFSQKIKFKGFL